MSGPVTECGLCGSEDLQPILDLGEQPLAERLDSDERYPLGLLRCRECLLVQASYIVDQEILFPPGHPYTTGTTRALREHFTALAWMLGSRADAGDLVVDIGANDGTLITAFPADLRRVAVEPTGQAERCRAAGIPTYRDFFTTQVAAEILDAHGPARLVTATNVLAHVPDPHEFLEGVEYLLDDGGEFVTENHFLGSITDGLQFDTVYHEHLRYYSIETLSRLLGMHGFQAESATRTSVHGGSFRVIARKRHHADLDVRASKAAARLRDLLAGLDGAVYGIGAATRAVPLIHYAGLADRLAAVCEVPGSEKIGHSIPGTKIPIVPDDVLLTSQPPYALIFPWHLAASLEGLYRERGYRGKFIVPLPEPRVDE